MRYLTRKAIPAVIRANAALLLSSVAIIHEFQRSAAGHSAIEPSATAVQSAIAVVCWN